MGEISNVIDTAVPSESRIKKVEIDIIFKVSNNQRLQEVLAGVGLLDQIFRYYSCDYSFNKL